MTRARGPGRRTGIVRQLPSSQADWPTQALNDPDYADAFAVDERERDVAPAEDRMRRVLEGAPAALRLFVQIGWRFVLGFRPARSGILGWPVAAATDDSVLLEQRSRLVAAALLLRSTPAGLTWGTRVHFESRLGRPVWAVVGVLHRRIVPFLLARAVAESEGMHRT